MTNDPSTGSGSSRAKSRDDKIQMKNFVNIILFIALAVFMAASVSAQNEEVKPLEELTKEELLKEITERLDYNPEALAFIPELNMEEDEEGNIFYTHTSGDRITKKLEELDRTSLEKIFNRVTSETNRLNTERLIRQLEQVRQAQQPPKVPPQPAKIYTPPKTPRQPGPPPSLPPRHDGPPAGGPRK